MTDDSTPKRSEELWFEDGDIVLSVVEDGAENHFRVHRAILAIHSPVFREMFSMQQPSRGGSLPVPLIDDSVQDVTALLRELYIGRKAQTVTFDVALGILRLSHKYQIEGLQERMKQKLLEDWPLDRSDYLARLTFLKSPGYRILPASKLIKTAQQCDIKELLPTAFYELACAWGMRWEEIVENLSDENVTRLCAGRARSERRLRALASMTPSLMMWSRSNVDQAIIKYREKFPACKLFKFRSSLGTYCPSVPSMFRTIIGKRVFDGVFVLAALQEVGLGDFAEGDCKGCTDWFMGVLENKIQELWENIPADFDLPAIDYS